MEEPLFAGRLPHEPPGPTPPPAAAVTSLAQAQALIAELQARQDKLHRENQQLRQAQQQLRASEARLKAAEAVAQLGSYELDVATGAIHFSDGMCRLFGQEPGTFAPSLAWLDARSDPDDAAAVQRVLAQAIAQRQPYQYTRRIRRADGQWRLLESHGRVVVDAAGQPLRLEGVVQDQTERQGTAQALLASQEQFRLFVTASLNVVYQMSADWRQMYRLAGQRVMADTPTTTDSWLQAYIPAEDWPVVSAAIEQAIRSKSIFELEHRVFLADGSVGWVHSRAMPVLDARGELVEWIGTGSDITARKHAEEHWHTAAQRLQATLDSSFFSVQAFEAVRDEQGRIVDFTWVFTNKVWVSQHGNVVGKRLLTQNPGVVESGLFALFVQVTETGVPVDHEVYYGYEQFDGWFHQTLVQLGDGFVMNTEDITPRKQAEQELQASRALLQATIDSSLDMIQVFEAVRNEQGDIIDFRWVLNNAVAEQTYGDVIGQLLLVCNPGVVEVGIFDTLKQVVETGQPDRSERHYAHEQFDGWFTQSTVRLNDGVATTTADITALKHAQQEHLRRFTLLEQAEAVAQLGSWEYEPAAERMRWSAGMYRLFQLPPGHPVYPALYLDYVVAEDRPAAERLVHCLTKAPCDLEETLRLRVGPVEKTVRVKVVVLPDAAGRPVRLLGVDADVSDVHRLEQENLRMRLQQQQTLFNAVLDAQETERRRIAEGLHNGVGQVLYATKLQLDQLQPADASPVWRRATELLADAIRQTRALSHELVPMVLNEYGLEAAVQDICRTISTKQLRFDCHLELEELPRSLPQPLQVALFRMAQELAQNVVKHAHATEASLALEVVPGYVLLRAEDNGVGFPAEPKGAGLGLRSIRDRVELLGGHMETGSSPAVGTFVRIRIPLPAASG
ncbi:PAS domain-containing protein [Hymenobacter sp. 15J16-1T3B]|uniref:sensor histidine kinase n=1 Tax=Hymenobacter sp. 15J16-1T3B TaxID=2886941 RepID=UPI001D106AB9|nr:PAS domain-containing protein [Hymenobacter sp. 15J16-1T3B]MCC3156025.1 PAS domain-containing protein [Hymenobacter sp. 15J16-1T3B]